MDSLVHRQCRHPVQPMGGVCAVCLKERLSNISGLRCGSGAAITGDVSERWSSNLNAQPLKQLLGEQSDLRHHVDAPAEMFNEVMLMSQEITEARQSIASLIGREIVEAHRRYSDVASRCCYEASHNQLLRSKSTSQLDAYSRLDGNKSLQLSSSHRRPRSGKSNMTIKSFASSAMKPLVHLHDLRRGTTSSPQCHSNGTGKQMRFELQDKTAQPLLRKSKSTGWILNHHLTRDCNNKLSERRSPIDLLSWRKKRKTSSVSNVSLEDSAPLMMTPCSRKDGPPSSIKTKGIMWRPLKILFRWRGSGKPSFTPPMASLGTPWSTSSSSSSCTQCAPEKNPHHEVSLPELDDHVEPEHVVCGRRLHRLLSQVRPQGSFNATVMESAVGVDAYVEQTMYSQKEAVPCSSDFSQDVDSMRHEVLHDGLQSAVLEEGSRRRAGGEVPLKRGQGSSAMISSSRVLKVAKSTSSSTRESSMCSALSSSLPSFATVLDTPMIYSNSKMKSGNACLVSIAALMSMDVNTTSPLKMAC